tara:strand:+ start:134 stop:937 length:804 start_codon:yes stop_codon:yes gene_type:complete
MYTNDKENQVLSMDKLREICPVIFADQPSSNVTDKYTHIPTNRVVDDMMQLGWNPINAQQVKARKNRGFQKHMVVFRNENLLIKGQDGDDSYVQLLLTNSHDGKNSFKFEAGIFRLVCANGLVVKSTDMGSFKLRHMGYTFEELQTQLNEFVSNLDGVVEKMNKMVNKTISVDAAKKLAQRALQVRFNNKNEKFDDKLLTEMITPVRIEDKGDSLWKAFNVIQERIIEGDFQYKSGSKLRKARKIKNFQQDMKVNQQLWELAEEFVN